MRENLKYIFIESEKISLKILEFLAFLNLFCAVVFIYVCVYISHRIMNPFWDAKVTIQVMKCILFTEELILALIIGSNRYKYFGTAVFGEL